jgi:ABC-type sugar transport system permease subunit
MSVTAFSISNPVHPFVGLVNYTQFFSDIRLWDSLKRSLISGFFGGGIAFLLGLFMALLVNSDWAPLRVRDFMKGLFIMPWVISTTLAALMWGLMLNSNGIIDSLLIQMGLIHTPIFFIGTLAYTFPSLILIFAWKVYPFSLVMILAAMKSIPNEINDAAKVDGASKWQHLIFVTLPLVMPVLLTIALLMFIWGFGQYDLIRVITGGGPVYSTEVASYYIYYVGFLESRFSYAAAISILVFAILILLGIVYVRLYARSRSWG